MSRAVAAGLLGHDYQGRVFLTHAARLRVPGSNVAKVGYEHDLVRAFDDVVVYYERPLIDEAYGRVDADLLQVKYQVRQGDKVTWEALMDPAFINASAVSLLQRLRDGAAELDRAGLRGRFTLASPRPIDDALRRLLSNAGDAIDLDLLCDGTTRTERGKIRQAWMRHLGLSSVDELRAVLAPLRIRQTPSLDELRREADVNLREAGLVPWPGDERASRYDDLPKKLATAGVTLLDRASFEALVAQEGLIVRPPLAPGGPPRRLGIRSFLKHAEGMASETDDLCCLIEHFEGRAIRDPDLWDARVRPAMDAFLTRAAQGATAIDLHLAAHASVAFVAGWHLDMKAPMDVAPVQGGVVWRPSLATPSAEGVWQEASEHWAEGPDLALVLSVTRDIGTDVREFVAAHVPTVGTALHLTLAPRPGQGAVRDGTHAFRLAEAAVEAVHRRLPCGPGRGRIHLFGAAPNAVLFFLGRMARGLGRLQLYEHNFERDAADAYAPSFRLG